MSRIFFLTGRETLPAAVAARLLAERKPEGGLLSFEDTMILTMTAQTGRRIVDRLAQAARDQDAILLPPRTGTPAGLTKGQDPAVATALQSAATWVETVLAADEAWVRQAGWRRVDTGGRTDLGLGLYGLAKETAKAGLTVSAAAGKIDAPEDAERWSAWAELERRYLRKLKDRGKRCPQEAELARAQEPVLPEGIHRVMLAGVVDVSPLAAMALESLVKKGTPVEILSWAPGLSEPEAREAFDGRGRAQAEFWEKKEMLAGVEPELRRDGADLAQATVAHLAEKLSKKNPGKTAVVADDAALGRDLAGRIGQAGGQAYLAAGRPLEEQAMRKLLRGLADFCREGSFLSMDGLLHQPDFLRWILAEVKFAEGAGRWLGHWSKSGYETMEADLGSTLRMSLESVGDPVVPVLRRMAQLRKSLGGTKWPAELRALLLAIYGERELQEDRGEVEAAKSIDEALTEAEGGTAQELGLAGWVELLGSLGGSWTEEKARGAVEIQGWLDAAGEDAEFLVLAGMNEGLLPRGPSPDAMLTEAAKRKLGLPDREFLQARDLCLLHGMEKGRKKGGLIVLTAQNGEAGEPLRPSRLLFRVPDGELAKRVEKLAVEVEPRETGKARETFQRHKLRIPLPPKDGRTDLLHVTDFSAFLACPLRFYLSRRLGWRPGEEPAPGLDGRRFGTWMHEVLGAFGEDPGMRECGEPEKIYERVRAAWDAKFLPWEEAGALRLTLDLQRESGRERLKRFAEEQAELVRQGWRIRSTETILGEERELPGRPGKVKCFSIGLDGFWVTGRADRIDEHPEHGLRVVDYKTGREKEAAAYHFAGTRKVTFARSPGYARLTRTEQKGKGEPACWINLQLPLYLEGVAAEKRPAEAGYFYLGEALAEIGWKPLVLTKEERESAGKCAREAAKEYRDDAVLDWIRQGKWERLAVKTAYDDFEELGLGRFIEERAIEVQRAGPDEDEDEDEGEAQRMSVRLSHLRITASAGTGKTFRLTDRIVELLLLGVEPRKILALTFTRKAAGEFLRKLLEKLALGSEKAGEAKNFFERRRDSAQESGLEALAKHYAAQAKRPEAELRAEFRRVLRRVTEDLDRLEMGTLDSFLFRLVRSFAAELGLDRELRVLDEAAEEREEAEVLGELAASLGADPEVRAQLRRDLIGGEKGTAPADPLRAEVRELQEAERIWHEEPGAVWGGAKELFPKGLPPAAQVAEPAWTGLPAGWSDFPAGVREMATAGPGTKLSHKAGKLLENIAGLEAGQAEFTFNRKAAVLTGDMARYAGSVAREYVRKLVDWKLGKTKRQGEYAQRLVKVREMRRERAGMLRFADLPRIARDEVVQVPLLAYRLDGWFDHWLLDEFQDTSRSQWAALAPLVQEVWQDSEGRRTIFYVGDVKQAIYGWRGGDAGLFTDIARGYEGRLKDERLSRSFRSGEKVLQAVGDVFAPRALRAAGVDGKVVAGWEQGWTNHDFSESNQGQGHVEIRAAEGEDIWAAVAALVKKTRVLEKGGTVGVLTRTNDLAQEGAELLSQEGLKVTVEGKRPVVAEGPLGPACLLAARLAVDPADRLAAGGLGAGMLAGAVAEGAEKFAFRSLANFGHGGAEGMVRGWLGPAEVAGDPFLEESAEALVRAGRAFDRSGGGSVREFHRFLAEYQDPGATLRGAVQLMTMHKAKGLEFDLTFVVLERGRGRSLSLDSVKGPHLRSGATSGGRWVMELPARPICDAVPELAAEMDRVRREAMLANLCLHYVAMTRARQALVLVMPPIKDSEAHGAKKEKEKPDGEA